MTQAGTLHATVHWKGLTSLMQALERGKVRTTPRISQMTRAIGEKVHEKYVENLSGSVPSTAAQPLPVGVRTGKLRQGAKMVQVNQYRVDERNETDYAGWIEMGTSKMVPRRPLGDALDQVGEGLPGEMGQVQRDIWRA